MEIQAKIISLKNIETSVIKKLDIIGDILLGINANLNEIKQNQIVETDLMNNVLETTTEMVKVLNKGTFIISKKKLGKIKKKYNIFHKSKLEEN